MRWWLPMLLAGCVPAPSTTDSGPAEGIALPANSRLAAGCADGGLQVSYALTAHAEFAAYVVAVNDGTTELARYELGAEGEGTQAVAPEVAAMCAPCQFRLYGTTAAGDGDALLTVEAGVPDVDEDGFGAATCGGDDCDDGDDAVHPDGTEVCDGVDNDCSGAVDDLEDAPLADLQLGVCAGAVKQCDGNGGWVEPDYGLLANYETTEASCDGLDNDCDGTEDNALIAPAADLTDGECAGSTKVCDGTNGWVEPDYTQIATYEAAESACDGLDNDCDGMEDNGLNAPTADEQNGVCAGSVKTCDGTNGWVEPDFSQIAEYEATETSCDGLDNDCDGTEDNGLPSVAADLTDGECAGQVKWCDGGNGWQEPDYTQIATYEAQEQTCDGLDNDCNGIEDDLATAPLADMQAGVCDGARKVCDGAGGFTEPDYTQIAGYEADETLCDGLDNDCDTVVDVFDEAPPLADLQDGVCRDATKVCDPDTGGWMEPDYSDHSELYGDEVCDWYDNDCNGLEDDDVTDFREGRLTEGVCAGVGMECSDSTLWVQPYYDLEVPEYEFIEETCDGLDNDCDGVVDEVAVLSETETTLECWGYYPRPLPEQIDAGPWRMLESDENGGYVHSCAIDEADQMVCWGQNYDGAIGDGSITSTPLFHHVPGDWLDVTMVDAGTCALDTDGVLWCWGNWPFETDLDLGYTPKRIDDGPWVDIDAGYAHLCLRDASDQLACMGRNTTEQLGFADAGFEHVPVLLSGTWDQHSLGLGHTCAVTGGNLYCWGDNGYGELAADPNTVTGSAAPLAVDHPTGMDWVEVAAGSRMTCALDADGAVWCWGYNFGDLLGVVGDDKIATPTLVHAGPHTWVETGSRRICAGAADGGLWCWGDNADWSMGLGDKAEDVLTPTEIHAELGADVGMSWAVTCALSDTDRSLWCWGGDIYSHYGVGPGPESVRTLDAAGARAITGANYYVTCYIAEADGALYCAGENAGVMGSGAIDTQVPYRVADGPFVDVAATADYQSGEGWFSGACAIDSTGGRWCWGVNHEAQLATGDTAFVDDPTRIADGITWATVDLDRDSGVGLDADGLAYEWGGSVTSPAVLATVDQVEAGWRANCAIDTAGTLECWGANNRGQLGLGATDSTTRSFDQRVSPVEAGPWRQVSMRRNRVCAVKQDDTLWCWSDGYGATPTQIAGAWSSVHVAPYHACGIQTDETAWCWGYNGEHQIGRLVDWSTDYFEEPVQMPGGGWKQLGGGEARTCGVRAAYTTTQCGT